VQLRRTRHNLKKNGSKEKKLKKSAVFLMGQKANKKIKVSEVERVFIAFVAS